MWEPHAPIGTTRPAPYVPPPFTHTPRFPHLVWAYPPAGVVPLPFFHLLSYLTPKQLQAYHDAVIEPLHDEGPAHNPVAGLTALPPVLTGIGALALDVVSAIGFVAYTCAVSKTLTLTTLAAAALVTRGARKAM